MRGRGLALLGAIVGVGYCVRLSGDCGGIG